MAYSQNSNNNNNMIFLYIIHIQSPAYCCSLQPCRCCVFLLMNTLEYFITIITSLFLSSLFLFISGRNVYRHFFITIFSVSLVCDINTKLQYYNKAIKSFSPCELEWSIEMGSRGMIQDKMADGFYSAFDLKVP